MTAHGTPPPAILAPVPRSGHFLTFSLAPGAILAPLWPRSRRSRASSTGPSGSRAPWPVATTGVPRRSPARSTFARSAC